MIENVDVVHPFGATLYGDEIFWTDWGRKSVEAIHKHGRVGSRAHLVLIVIISLFCDLVFYFFLKVDKFIL